MTALPLMWDAMKLQRAAPVRSASSKATTPLSHAAHSGGAPHRKGQATASPLPHNHHCWLTPTLGKRKLKAWGAALLQTLPQVLQEMAAKVHSGSSEGHCSPSTQSSLSSVSESQCEGPSDWRYSPSLQSSSPSSDLVCEARYGNQEPSSPLSSCGSSASVPGSINGQLCSQALSSTHVSLALGPEASTEERGSPALPSNCPESPLWTFRGAYGSADSPLANQLSPSLRGSALKSALNSLCRRRNCVSPLQAKQHSLALPSSLEPEAACKRQHNPALPSNCVGSPSGTLCGRRSFVSSPTAIRQSAHKQKRSLSSASVSDAESHMSRHEQDKSIKIRFESFPQPQFSSTPGRSQGPHAEQVAPGPRQCGAKRGRCASTYQPMSAKRHAPSVGEATEVVRLHPSGGSQYVEWLASGRAPCQVSERASIAAEVKSLKGSDEVMPLSGQKHSSPAKQYPTHDISLARAVLQGSALVRIHSALSVLSERELLPDMASIIKGQPHESAMSKIEATLCALFCLCRNAQLDPSRIAASPDVLLTFLWILLSFHGPDADSATDAIRLMRATKASQLYTWTHILVDLQRVLLQRIDWNVRPTGKEMLEAHEQLRKCTGARARAATRFTDPNGHLITPALHLRCKAVEATKEQLRKLPVDEGTNSYYASAKHAGSCNSASGTFLASPPERRPILARIKHLSSCFKI